MTETTGTDTWPDNWPDDWREAAETGTCLHCGNGLGRFWKPADGPFCCRGCRSVWEMINQEHLERFYDLKTDRLAPAAKLRPETFNWLDRLIAEREQSATGSSGPLHLDLDIQGVHCAACVWLIEELFKRQEAGIQLRINPTLGKVELIWDPARGDLKEFLAEVEKFGYRLGPSRKGAHRHARGLVMRMAISIAMAMNVMIFSLSYYFGLAPEDGALYGVFGWVSLALATVSVIAGGGVFFKGAVAGLRRRVLHLDVPISLGMVLAYGGSVYGFLSHGPEHAYFDSLTVFIALMLVGRWAQEHILERNRNALLDASGAENLTAKRLRDGVPEPIGAVDVVAGDELWIAPGDLVPTAGILLRRSTQVSLDWITGESDQVDFNPGDTIPAGAFNASSGGFSVTAVESFHDSRLQDLLRSTSLADASFRPKWWHRISTWYVTLVLLAAAIGFVGWATVDVTTALKVTIAILVVTCPCALGLATPLAEELVHFALRQAGIFVRKSDFMEKALLVRKVLLDKTGTLTMGDLILDDASHQALAALRPDEQAVLAQMTGRSNHPVSRCINVALTGRPRAQAAGAASTAPADDATEPAAVNLAVEALVEKPGCGLELTLPDDIWRLGRADWAKTPADDDRSAAHSTNGPADPSASARVQETVFSHNGRPLATIRLSEEFKADAAGEVQTLRQAGFDVYLVSGDAQAKVDAAARALNIPAERAWGGLSPEDKAARVRDLDQTDTLMVGDGLNDSPSFEVALCAATPAVDRPVLPGKADFYFLGDGISALRRGLLAARHLRKVIRDNLVFAIFYNLLAVGLCFAALVTPVVAAILMPISSVFVVTWTAIRLSRRRLSWMSS